MERGEKGWLFIKDNEWRIAPLIVFFSEGNSYEQSCFPERIVLSVRQVLAKGYSLRTILKTISSVKSGRGIVADLPFVVILMELTISVPVFVL